MLWIYYEGTSEEVCPLVVKNMQRHVLAGVQRAPGKGTLSI